MSNTERAIAFLTQCTNGQIETAYKEYVDLNGKHHNIYTPAGMAALKQGMLDNDHQFPDKQLTIKQTIANNDTVAVYSHLTFNPGESGMAVVHILRFENDKIVEIWDCGQAIPTDSPNTDGPF